MNRFFPIASIFLVLVLAGCASSHPTAHHTAAPVVSLTSQAPNVTASASTSYPDTGTTDGSLMSCSTVVDSGSQNGGNFTGSNITAQHVISILEVFVLDGLVQLNTGNLTTSEINALWAAAQDLQNYSGDQLANDAEQYAQDEPNT